MDALNEQRRQPNTIRQFAGCSHYVVHQTADSSLQEFSSRSADLGQVHTLYAACRLTVVAVDADQRVVGQMTGDLLVQDELRSGDATLVLSDSDGDELERWTAQPGLPLSDRLSLDTSQELKVSRCLEPINARSS